MNENKSITKAEQLYGDIIDTKYAGSMNRTAMPMSDRAAQFSPFAALVGYGEAVKETTRLTDSEMELTEDKMLELNQTIQYLREHIEDDLNVRVVYFVPDGKKSGGSYDTYTGVLRCIDEYNRVLVFYDAVRIGFEVIYSIDIVK